MIVPVIRALGSDGTDLDGAVGIEQRHAQRARADVVQAGFQGLAEGRNAAQEPRSTPSLPQRRAIAPTRVG